MNQLQLDLPPPRARRADPQTSKAAALRVKHGELYQLVLWSLATSGAGSSHDVAARLSASLVSISPRMKPLEVAGFITHSGVRDGRTIWEVTPAGVAACAGAK